MCPTSLAANHLATLTFVQLLKCLALLFTTPPTPKPSQRSFPLLLGQSAIRFTGPITEYHFLWGAFPDFPVQVKFPCRGSLRPPYFPTQSTCTPMSHSLSFVASSENHACQRAGTGQGCPRMYLQHLTRCLGQGLSTYC